MPIPRLTPSANPIDVTITVNERLRPYFEIWFQRKKLSGESPSQFALRVLKMNALNDYLNDVGKAEVDQIEAEKAAALDALQTDAHSIEGEVD